MKTIENIFKLLLSILLSPLFLIRQICLTFFDICNEIYDFFIRLKYKF